MINYYDGNIAQIINDLLKWIEELLLRFFSIERTNRQRNYLSQI